MPGGIFPARKRSLVWVDRSGAIEPLPLPPRSYLKPRLSPDGERLALYEENPMWVLVYDLRRGTLTRLPNQQEGLNMDPVWTPDGKRLAFVSAAIGATNVYWAPADFTGTPERLTTSERNQRLGSWSPDGKTLAFTQTEPPPLGFDIWTLSMTDRTVRPVLRTAANEQWPDFSPDGRWLAYASNESGRFEVYVQPYPGPGPRHQISTHGGESPAWARNGRELFYTVPAPNTRSVEMMAVDIATTPTFAAGVPRPLQSVVRLVPPTRGYDVAPDGRRFITTPEMEGPPEPPPSQMILVQNWHEELKRRVPTK